MALTGFVATEIAILNKPSWTVTEAFYVGVGILMVGLGALVAAVE